MGNHVGPHGQSRGPSGAITWAPRGNQVGPHGKSRKSSSGSRASNSRHKTRINWQSRISLLAFRSYLVYKRELHSNAWLTMKWKFHHIVLLLTSKLTSKSPLSQNVKGLTGCSFQLDSAEFSKEKARVLYFQWLLFNCVIEDSYGMVNFDDIISLSACCQDVFHRSFSR